MRDADLHDQRAMRSSTFVSQLVMARGCASPFVVGSIRAATCSPLCAMYGGSAGGPRA